MSFYLGIDMNEDIRTGKLARRLKELGLRELILSTHPDASPPATFSGNNSRTPIDSFFGSEGVEVLRAGYTPFDQVIPAAPSDGHRLIWLETCNFSILGKEIPHSTKPCPTKGPNSKDPRCRKAYGKRVRKEYINQDIFTTFKKLKSSANKFKKGSIKHPRKFISKFTNRFNDFHSRTRAIKTKIAKEI